MEDFRQNFVTSFDRISEILERTATETRVLARADTDERGAIVTTTVTC